MKTLSTIFSIILFVFSVGIILLYGASGHRIRWNDSDTILSLAITALYILTGASLLMHSRLSKQGFRKFVILLLSLVFVSFIYLFIEMVSIKIGDYAAFIPIFLMLISSVLCGRLLFMLGTDKEYDN